MHTTTQSAEATRLGIDTVERLSRTTGVPREDVLLIAINLFGISSNVPRHRARVRIRLDGAPDPAWMAIVPLNVTGSPFTLSGEDLFLDGAHVAGVDRIDADDAVGGYFRNGGAAATLNPNARSRCVGCAFCPNTLEAAADPRMAEETALAALFDALHEQHPRQDLSELREITVSTGCFEHEEPAVEHLVSLRRELGRRGVDASIGFLTSVITSDAGFRRLAQEVTPFILRLTIECLGRRSMMLKASKAMLTPDAMPGVLARAAAVGLDTSFTYIVGLDDHEVLRAGLEDLVPHVTRFPNFQVYQAHNAIMEGLRTPGADDVAYYLRARTIIEEAFASSDLRPQAWEGYRPLWYTTFAGERLVA
ncbi:hypothetical protein GCM10027063_36870 [Promicromonospora xylanilytica]